MIHNPDLIQRLNKLESGGVFMLPVSYKDEKNVLLLLALTQHRQWTIVENISPSGKSRFSVRRAA